MAVSLEGAALGRINPLPAVEDLLVAVGSLGHHAQDTVLLGGGGMPGLELTMNRNFKGHASRHPFAQARRQLQPQGLQEHHARGGFRRRGQGFGFLCARPIGRPAGAVL